MSPSFYAEPPEAPREDTLRAYLQFLEERDGSTDPTRPYPKRESWLAAADAAPIRHGPPVDAAAFERNYVRFDPSTEPDSAAVMLLAFVKMNAGEAYGIEVLTRTRLRGPISTGNLIEYVERILGREETYHTRILAGAAHQFGLEPPSGAWRAPLPLKVLIGSMAYSPKAIFHPIVLGAEIGGIFTLEWMLKKVREVMKGEPSLRDAMEDRIAEILVDEIGHAAFNRMMVGRTGVAVARKLAGRIASATTGLTPEFRALGWTGSTADALAKFDYSSLPEHVRRRAFFA